MDVLNGPASVQSPPIRYAQLCELTIRQLFWNTKLNEKSNFNVKYLEIGSWIGASACLFSKIATLFSQIKKFDFELICVDPFEPYLIDEGLHYLEMEHALQNKTVLSFFTENVSRFGNLEFIKFKCQKSKDFFQNNNMLFDFIYIDGAHYYNEVYVDLKESKKSVKRNGLLVGDDLEKLKMNVKHLSPGDNYKTIDYDEGYHPGVTKAFTELFPNINIVNTSGLWALQKLQDNTFVSIIQDENVKLIPNWIDIKNTIFLLETRDDLNSNLVLTNHGIFSVPFSAGEINYDDLIVPRFDIKWHQSRKEYFENQVLKTIINLLSK